MASIQEEMEKLIENAEKNSPYIKMHEKLKKKKKKETAREKRRRLQFETSKLHHTGLRL